MSGLVSASLLSHLKLIPCRMPRTGCMLLASLSVGFLSGCGSTPTGSSQSKPTVSPALTAISCTHASVTSAISDSCTVTLSSAAPSNGVQIVLSSNNPAVIVPPSVTVGANQSSGSFTATIASVASPTVVTLTASDGSMNKTFSVALASSASLSVNATALSFGNVVVGVPVTQTVTLSANGASAVTIERVSLSGAAFAMTPLSLPLTLNPGQSSSFSVSFVPTALGTNTGQLSIASDSTAFTVALAGTGVAAKGFSYDQSPLQANYAPPVSSNAIPASYFGMTIHHTATPFPNFAVSTFRFWDVAAWGTIETADGMYDWTHVDTSLRIGQDNGVSDYVFVFGDVPKWASTNPSAPCTNGDGIGTCSPPDESALREFATTLVRRYCGKIKYYETWNEPNNASYWNGNNNQLLAVAQDIDAIVKDPANCGCARGVCGPNGGANPNQVLLPSISRINPTTLAWLDSYLGAAGASYPYADIATFHGYPNLTDAGPEQIISQVASLKSVLAAHGLSDLPLWNTEGSWGNAQVVDDDHASWLMRDHVAQAVAGVSRFIWYAYDNCGWGTLWEAPWCSSPQMPTNQQTIPGNAYGVIEQWMSGANLAGCQQYQDGLWSCELDRSGSPRAWMVWSSSGAAIDLPIPSLSGLTHYRDSQNSEQALTTNLEVDQMPVLLESVSP